jgi:hypothetical protein
LFMNRVSKDGELRPIMPRRWRVAKSKGAATQ